MKRYLICVLETLIIGCHCAEKSRIGSNSVGQCRLDFADEQESCVKCGCLDCQCGVNETYAPRYDSCMGGCTYWQVEGFHVSLTVKGESAKIFVPRCAEKRCGLVCWPKIYFSARLVLPSCSVLRDGFAFDKWECICGGDRQTYSEGDAIRVTTNMEFTATWKEKR